LVEKKVRTYLYSVILLFFMSLRLLAQTTPPSGYSVGSSAQSQDVTRQLNAAQSPMTGSRAVPLQPGTVNLTLLDAIDRGLKYNLGIILTQQGNESARAARIRALSELLPHINARVGGSGQQVNLAAYGIPFAPGTPSVVGPFALFDARATATENVSVRYLYEKRAADQSLNAAKFSYQNTRDLVVLVTGASYLQTLADASRVDSVTAQVQTAQALYDQAVNLKNAGMTAGIDVLRAQVELQAQQQRLLVAQNDYDKQLLSLARVIGIPMGQDFKLTDKIPFAAPVPITFEEALKRAFDKRSDYKQAQAQLHSAELLKRAAEAERLPSLALNGDYGVLGPAPANSHGTFTAAAGINIPIFQGRKIEADVIQAEAVRQQREAELDDLRQRIEYEVRTAFLDVNAATKQLEVATSALDVSRQQVIQSRDRFSAGVTNTVEVVQAQQQRATAEENYIASLYAHNVAKLSLARALGITEEATKRFLGGQH
jgi:outer membrane protein TolC